LSIRSAKKAKKYKEETLKFKDTIDLRTLLNRFITESQCYQNQTRKLDWFRGIDANLVITPFNKVLVSFGELYDLMENSKEIKEKVHHLQEAIQQYQKSTRTLQKEVNNYIIEIIELLQLETKRRTVDIITSK